MQSVRLTCHVCGVDETEQLQLLRLSEVGDQVYMGGGFLEQVQYCVKACGERILDQMCAGERRSRSFWGLEREMMDSCFLPSTMSTRTLQMETLLLKRLFGITSN